MADEYFINDEYPYVVKRKKKLQRVSSKEVFIFIKGLPEMNRGRGTLGETRHVLPHLEAKEAIRNSESLVIFLFTLSLNNNEKERERKAKSP